MSARPAGLVLSCEHASNRVPPGVDLDVPDDVLASHVAWDHGAADIARGLESALGCPASYGAWTRMFVDLNRFPTTPSVVPEIAFGTPVPGNVGLTVEQRAERLETVHRPWRDAVQAEIARVVARDGACVHFSVHSFTPRLRDEVRDFDMGILYDPDRLLDRVVADVLVDGLNRLGLATRRNEPYLGTGDGLTTATRLLHPEDVYAGIEVETSHRVTEAPGGIDRVVRALVEVVPAALAAAGRVAAVRTAKA